MQCQRLFHRSVFLPFQEESELALVHMDALRELYNSSLERHDSTFTADEIDISGQSWHADSMQAHDQHRPTTFANNPQLRIRGAKDSMKAR